MIRLESDKNVSAQQSKFTPTPMQPSHVQFYILRKYPHLVFFSNGGLRLEWSWRSAVSDIDQQSIKQTPAVKGTNKGNYHPRLHSQRFFYLNLTKKQIKNQSKKTDSYRKRHQ